MSEQEVTPWDVKGAVVDGVQQAVDYEKIVKQFGSQLIDDALLERFEKVTGRKPHRFLRRGIFYSHRDLNKILDLHEAGKPFYLYTGRGPSSDSLHSGHMIPFIFCQYLQEIFDVPIVIQMTDDEKFLVKDMSLEDADRYLKENSKDVIACGFDYNKTFIFSDTGYLKHMVPNIMKLQKRVSYRDINKNFGFDESTALGKFGFPPIQMVPCFSDTFPHIFGGKKNIPCLIPCAIDQDVYFRLTREVAGPLKYPKPALVHSKFFPALQGSQTKMSASDVSSAIFACDSMELIEEKVMKYAKEADRGPNGEFDIDDDVPYAYLTFFLDDDEKLASIKEDYSCGKISSDDVKKVLISELQTLLGEFQERRKKLTPEDVLRFMEVRDMQITK